MARLVTNFKKSFGPGGKSSNSGLTVAVFGGHGFLGRYLLNDLGLSGTRVYLPYRGDEFEVRHVKPSFDLGQFAAVPFHPRDKDSIREALKNADIVVNYIGKYYETKHIVSTKRADGKKSRVNYSFDEVHSQIPATIAQIAKDAGVSRFIHVSAMSANPDSLSEWSRSKARGEAAVRQVFPEAVIVRPATVFGAEDRFLNWIAEGISKLPFFPLINSGSTLIQPVYVRDVARGVLEIIANFEQYSGKTFEFAGPAEYSHKEIAEFVKDVIMYKKPLVDVSPWTARLAGSVIQELISPVLTADMVNQMLEDNVLKKKENVLTLEDLKITPSSMDRYAFDYLHRFRRGGHFTLAKGYH